MIAAYPLQWPEGFPRTAKRENGQFKTALGAALDNVNKSLRQFGADSGKVVANIVLSSNVSLGAPHPDDPGIAAWFTWDGETRCIAVDRYVSPQANLQAIHHVLEARRTELRHGTLALVRASMRGFTLALPAPGMAWWQVLNLPQDCTLDAIDAAYRRLALERHPDRGGSREAMVELNIARDQARKARGTA